MSNRRISWSGMLPSECLAVWRVVVSIKENRWRLGYINAKHQQAIEAWKHPLKLIRAHKIILFMSVTKNNEPFKAYRYSRCYLYRLPSCFPSILILFILLLSLPPLCYYWIFLCFISSQILSFVNLNSKRYIKL